MYSTMNNFAALKSTKDQLVGVETGTPYISVKANQNRTRMKALESLGGAKHGNSVRIPQQKILKRMRVQTGKSRKLAETDLLNHD